MKIFKQFGQSGPPCPICGTHKDAETVLRQTPWIMLNGNRTCEVTPIHRKCYDLWREMNDLEPEEYES